ncbi:lymphocyte antigen 6 complex locus protein G6d-like [Genypterus blacodes]|uniref:lymphocyte antigen 6 complex locus protein G6d-like n=1 Tax=Genypterus blacodes TaxID=154954 RepID=UPI003F7664E9
MNRIILQLLAVTALFAVAHTLQCYDCSFGLFKWCMTSKVTCKEGEHCYSGKGKAASLVEINTKGCLKVAECNKTRDVDLPDKIANSTTVYSMTKTCCSSDLCNAAPGMTRTPMFALAMASITALFLALV